MRLRRRCNPSALGYVFVEVDEDQHRSYDISCDARRDFDIAASVSLGSAHKLRIVPTIPTASEWAASRSERAVRTGYDA